VRSLGGLSHSYTDAESAPCAAVTRRALPVAIYAGHAALIFANRRRFTYAPGGNPQTVPSAQGAAPLRLVKITGCLEAQQPGGVLTEDGGSIFLGDRQPTNAV
jgi:hypothetical protein